MVKKYHSSLTSSSTADHQAITFRLDRPVYDALSLACQTTGVSMNSIVNQAVATYLVAQVQTGLVTAPPDRSGYQAAIRKLSGSER